MVRHATRSSQTSRGGPKPELGNGRLVSQRDAKRLLPVARGSARHTTNRVPGSGRWAVAIALWLATGAGVLPAFADEAPSVLLVVVDTLRASAVSAYGPAVGTTPQMDALSEQGLRFLRAYAPSPWTSPSHATLFTGLGVDRHGVGLKGTPVLPEQAVTLAERMLAAGYQTVAFSENGLIGDRHQMLQGFEHRRTDRGSLVEAGTVLDTVAEVRNFLSGPKRDSDRPLFLFINLYDPHLPYKFRSENRWVPAGVDPRTLREIESWGPTRKPDRLLCGALPESGVIQILHGLYLGDVAAADAKLGKLVELVRKREAGRPLVTIVTSDHGEFFGERRLMGHLFSLHDAALHIPLIVHGLAGIEPASIDQAVGLEDIAPSILRWAGLDVPVDLPGRPLPQTAAPARAADRSLLSAFDDRMLSPPGEPEPPKGRRRKALDEGFRFSCGATDRVWGRMAVLIRYPYKYHWFERYPPELYDLSWDPGERSNQLALQPELAEKLAAEMQTAVERLAEPEFSSPEASPEAIELLRALGYVE